MGFWQSLAPELVVPYSPEKEMSDSIRLTLSSNPNAEIGKPRPRGITCELPHIGN
jgi:hypothetical protein